MYNLTGFDRCIPVRKLSVARWWMYPSHVSFWLCVLQNLQLTPCPSARTIKPLEAEHISETRAWCGKGIKFSPGFLKTNLILMIKIQQDIRIMMKYFRKTTIFKMSCYNKTKKRRWKDGSALKNPYCSSKLSVVPDNCWSRQRMCCPLLAPVSSYTHMYIHSHR